MLSAWRQQRRHGTGKRTRRFLLLPKLAKIFVPLLAKIFAQAWRCSNTSYVTYVIHILYEEYSISHYCITCILGALAQ